MKKILIMGLVLTMALSMSACGKKEEKTQDDTAAVTVESESAEETTSEEETVETFTITACGLDLKYPLEWQDKVTVTTEENRVDFACGDVKLFDLTFNTDEGYVLGTVEGDEYTVIRIVDYDIETEDNELYAMQEDVNVILQNLMNDYNFAVGEATEKIDDSTFDIKTSVVTMKYPCRWQDKVQIDVSDEGVKFSNDGTPLFDLMFEECDGYLLGTYKDTPIYIVDYSVDTDEQMIMQEDVNVILQNLMEDSNFVINN